VLREEKDKAFIIHFDKEVELLQDLTSSRVKLDKAVRELEVVNRSEDRIAAEAADIQAAGGMAVVEAADITAAAQPYTMRFCWHPTN